MDVSVFKPHSTRHAASSAAFNASVPIDEILKRAGWCNANTFRKFYYKDIIDCVTSMNVYLFNLMLL